MEVMQRIKSIGHLNFLHRLAKMFSTDIGNTRVRPATKLNIFSLHPTKVDEDLPIFLPKNEISLATAGGLHEFFPKNTWSEYAHNVLLNQEGTQPSTTLLYPDRKKYRAVLGKTKKYKHLDTPREMEKYDAVASKFEFLGVTYQKLRRPLTVMRHRCPRSIISLLHLTLHRAPVEER